MRTTNKYLEKIGAVPFLAEENWKGQAPKRMKRFRKQAKTRGGYDERETWAMDIVFAEWLYTHICMYEEFAGGIIDTDYHSIKVGKKEYTQKQAMKKIKKDLAEILRKSESFQWDPKLMKKFEKACLIWAKLAPLMWW